MEFDKTDRNRIRRVPARGHYDRETVYAILDAGFLCHVGFVVGGQPVVIPTIYGREGDSVYLHGSAASRMLGVLTKGCPACLTVTHTDGLVLARSAFHHSVNYRSAVLFGTASKVNGEQKELGLRIISENVLRGRWQEVRSPNEKELRVTSVLRLAIESASAKIRTGPPNDELEDYALEVWAGVIPLHQTFGDPEPDSQLRAGCAIPRSLADAFADRHRT